jgi:hypothetical protein
MISGTLGVAAETENVPCASRALAGLRYVGESVSIIADGSRNPMAANVPAPVAKSAAHSKASQPLAERRCTRFGRETA